MPMRKSQNNMEKAENRKRWQKNWFSGDPEMCLALGDWDP